MVPAHLKDGHYKGASALGHGVGYVYPHDRPGAWADQEYRPEEVASQIYWRPTGHGRDVARLGTVEAADRALPGASKQDQKREGLSDERI